jgi:hypothetical protein
MYKTFRLFQNMNIISTYFYCALNLTFCNDSVFCVYTIVICVTVGQYTIMHLEIQSDVYEKM